ncbi:MAG: type IV toxin-antitoxin system AbiEi family antitoxin domain-containing protein [Nocardioides sp.]|uniref:hypothetical protein n=1 Tax=Nocardioides sp. TaxID=35761 RepID=UPI0039E72456
MTTPDLPDQPATTADLTRAGWKRNDIRDACGTGVLRRVVRGVYVPVGLEDTLDLRARSIAKVVGPSHVLIDRSAAWLHGVSTLTLAETETLAPIETAALRGRNPTDRRDVVGRSRDLGVDDVMVVAGVRVTTPLRTALDLGCELRRREAMAGMNDLARLHRFTSLDLAAELPRFKGRRGVVQLKDLVPLVRHVMESPRESWTWLAIADAGLPLPECQLWVDVDGVPTYRLDFGYPVQKVAVEYDGVAAHLAAPEQRRHDEERRRRLQLLGWTVIVVRSGDFTGRSLDRWLDELRAALRGGYSPLRFAPTRREASPYSA